MHPNTKQRLQNQAKGLCMSCSKPRDSDRSNRHCAACLDKRNIAQRVDGTRTKYTVCQVCGTALTGKQRAYCNDHDWEHPKAAAMNRFKLTSAQYDSFGETCNSCGSTERLDMDHDHATGYVRGRLCRRCNQQLGRIEVDGWLKQTIAYLKRPQIGLKPITPRIG